VNRDGTSIGAAVLGGPQGQTKRGWDKRDAVGLQQDSHEVLGPGSGGDQGRGLMPIHVGSRHLVRVLEAEARKLEFAPLDRQVIVTSSRDYLGRRLKMDAHRSSVRPSRS
jgi:hypothetical protein